MTLWTPVEHDFDFDEFSDSDDEDSVAEERAAKHAKHCASRRGPPSIAGTYMIDCPEIENGWDNAGDLEMSINSTALPGFYEASFDFGIYEGVMMLSADRRALSFFSEEDVKDLDQAEEITVRKMGQNNGVKSQEEAEDRGNPSTGTKRKASDTGDSRPSKAAKTEAASNTSPSGATMLWLCLRTCETGTGEIHPNPSMGRITFNDTLTAFTGTVSIGCVGSNVPLRGRKISDTPKDTASWEDYGHAAAEAACNSRW